MTDTYKTDCLAIMALALETPRAKADIMCAWVAHCNFFEVRVYRGGWSQRTPEISAECHDLDVRNYTPAYHSEPSLVLAKIQALLA